jgi:hypothetical protein
MSNGAQRSPIKKTSRSTSAGVPTARPAVPGPARKLTVKVMFADGQSLWGTLQEYTASGVRVNLTGVYCFFPNVALVEAQAEGNFNEHLTATAVAPESLAAISKEVRVGLLCPQSFSDYSASLQ